MRKVLILLFLVSASLLSTSIGFGQEGSISLNGTSNDITVPNSSSFSPGTGDFTIEWFQRMSSTASSWPRVFSVGSYPSADLGVSLEGGTFYLWINSSFRASFSHGTLTNTWVHFAIVRSAGTIKVYQDGVVKATTSYASSISTSQTFRIGSEGVNGTYFGGQITNFRWSTNARYTANFTPPTTSFASDVNTKLLLKAASSSSLLTDSGPDNLTLTNNGATFSSSTPFGAACASAGTLAGNQSICVNGTSQFSTSGSSGGAWSSSNTAVATVSSTGLITAIGAGTASITYDITGTGGCANSSASRTVTVTAPPASAGTLAGTQAICVAGVSIFSTNGASGGTWTSSAAGVATVSTTGTVTGVSAGTSTITYTIAGTGGCADATATRTVTVTAPPVAGTLSGGQNIFIGATSTFSSTTSGGTWASSNASVATINSTTGVVTGVAAGTSTMTYTVAATGGCTSVSDTRTVAVFACPTIPALSASAYPVCAESNFTLTAAGLSGLSSLSTGITFIRSTTELTDPYVGGTVIATVPFASLEVANTIARTTTSIAAGGTYYIYAILSTTPGGTGCRPFAATTLVVNPVGQVTLPASSVVCSGASVAAQSLTTTNSGGTTTYSWTNSATSIGLAASGITSTIPAFTATNTGAAGVTATITVTPTYTAGGLSCPGPAGSYSITVNPVPAVNTVSNSLICNGTATSYTLAGPVTAALYNWTNSNTGIGLAATGSGSISFTATNTSADPISSTITVTPSLTNAGLTCTGGTMSFTVTVNPSGQVNAINNQVLCNGSTTVAATLSTTNNSTSIVGTGNASSGTISVSVPDASAVGATSTIPVTLPAGAIITNMRVTLNLTHTWISDMVINLRAPNGQILNLFNGHGGNGDDLVNTVISSTGTASLASGTAPFTGTFAATAAIGVGPTGNASTAANFAALYGTPNGNWVLALRDLFGGDLGTLTGWNLSIDYTIPVNFTTFNWTNSVTSIGLAASGTGNVPSFTAVNTGSAPVVSTVTVTPVFNSGGLGCAGTPVTYTYTVNPTATVNAVANQTFCAGAASTVAFSGNATGTVYSWTNTNTAIGLPASGTGNLSFTPTNTTNLPIEASITVTPSFTNAGVTCTGTPRTFTITVNPVGQVNTVLDQVICNGSNTTPVNFATVNGGGTVVAGTPVTVNSGALTVAVPDASATGVTHSIPVTLPAGATITGVSVNFNLTHTWVSDMVINLRAPNGQILNLVNRRGGSGDNFTNTTISSASTTSLATGTAPFTGTFAADAAAAVGPTSFVSAATNFAALYSVANGDWTLGMRDYAGGDVGTLTGWSITFNYTTVQGATTTYTWTNSLPSIGLAASGVGNIASFAASNTTAVPVTGTVSVTPTYTNNGVGCVGPATSFTYTVNPTPTVSAVSNQAVCVGSNVAAVTFAGTVSGTVYNWTNSNTAIGLPASGTGNIASFVGTNTGAAPISGTITVTPVATINGVTCTGTPRTFTITVNPIPTVNAVNSFPVCHNSTAAVTFSGATTGTVYSWTNTTTSIGLAASGTGNISFTALNTTSAPVVATIRVTPSYTNGGTTCTGTPTTFTITVNPLPVVSAGTLPARICLSDTLVPLNGTPVGGSWSGIGTSGMNFVPTATAVGTWPITYTFSDINGCTNRATIAATVLACEERDRDLDNSAILLYPNPNNGQFNLRVNSTRFNALGMRVFNTAGQLVSVKQWSGLVYARVIPVNLSSLPAGIYMVRLYYGDGMDRGADKTYQVIIAR
jgi:subtilisin-like proprotein convertase family protein